MYTQKLTIEGTNIPKEFIYNTCLSDYGEINNCVVSYVEMITASSSSPSPHRRNALSTMEVTLLGIFTWEHPQHDKQLQYWPSNIIHKLTLGLNHRKINCLSRIISEVYEISCARILTCNYNFGDEKEEDC